MFDRSTVFQEHQLKSSSEIILVHVSRRAFQSRLLRLPSRQLLHQLERKWNVPWLEQLQLGLLLNLLLLPRPQRWSSPLHHQVMWRFRPSLHNQVIPAPHQPILRLLALRRNLMIFKTSSPGRPVKSFHQQAISIVEKRNYNWHLLSWCLLSIYHAVQCLHYLHDFSCGALADATSKCCQS